MAVIDFPASPTVGQVFNAANGVSYQWNGVFWIALSGSSGMVALKTNAVTAQAITQFAQFTVAWSSVEFNNGGGTWSGSQFTVPVAGIYMVDFSVGFVWPNIGSPYAAQAEAHIYVNGADIVQTAANYNVTAGPISLNFPVRWLGQLAVGDTILFKGMMGGVAATFNNNKAYTSASIVRLGS